MQTMNDASWVAEMNIKGPNLRQDLREFLFDGEVEVKFEKVDGLSEYSNSTESWFNAVIYSKSAMIL